MGTKLKLHEIERRNTLFDTKLIGEYQGNHVKTLCKCGYCGNMFYALPSHIWNHQTKSCGCKQYKTDSLSCSWKGYRLISSVFFHRIKCNAESRNLLFNLDFKYLYNLLEKQGFTCKLSGLYLNLCDNQITASVDRINSSLGYVQDNIQWVHKDINQSKWHLSDVQYITYCKTITNFQATKEISKSCVVTSYGNRYKGVGNISGTYLSMIKRGAKSRGLDFEISDDYLWQLYKKQGGYCALSGLELKLNWKAKLQTASLDRKNSNFGYILDNVHWVYEDINRMKMWFSLDYFRYLCKRVAKNE